MIKYMSHHISHTVAASVALAVLLFALAGCEDAATTRAEMEELQQANHQLQEQIATLQEQVEALEGARGGAAAASEERPDLAESLIRAIAEDDEERAIELVNQGAPINATNAQGVPALFLAGGGCFECESAMVELSRLLLEKGANVNTSISRDIQPIHWVARSASTGRAGTREVLEMLVEHGADINARAGDGMRPIDYARRTGDEGLVDFMVSLGARLN